MTITIDVENEKRHLGELVEQALGGDLQRSTSYSMTSTKAANDNPAPSLSFKSHSASAI